MTAHNPEAEVMRNVHLSDCSTHNEPAFPAGPCDCGLVKLLAGRLRWHADNLAEDGGYDAIQSDLRLAANELIDTLALADGGSYPKAVFAIPGFEGTLEALDALTIRKEQP